MQDSELWIIRQNAYFEGSSTEVIDHEVCVPTQFLLAHSKSMCHSDRLLHREHIGNALVENYLGKLWRQAFKVGRGKGVDHSVYLLILEMLLSYL